MPNAYTCARQGTRSQYVIGDAPHALEGVRGGSFSIRIQDLEMSQHCVFQGHSRNQKTERKVRSRQHNCVHMWPHQACTARYPQTRVKLSLRVLKVSTIRIVCINTSARTSRPLVCATCKTFSTVSGPHPSLLHDTV